MTILSFEAQGSKSFISHLRYILWVFIGSLSGLLLLIAGGREAQVIARGLIKLHPSLWMLLVSAFVPLVATFFLLRQKRRAILYLLIALKSFLFTYSTCAVFIAFPSAGWLVQFLTSISSWLGICVHHWLWMRLLVFQTRTPNWDFLISGCILLLIVLFDYFLIGPFTALLFIHK